MNLQINYSSPIIIRDNEQRSKNVIIAFWVLIAVNLISIISGYLQLELLQVSENGGFYTDEEATVNDLRQQIIGIVQSIILLVLAVLFIMWLRRAYVNAGSISDRRLRHDDNWAIWGSILPIVSWWYPYVFADEINEKMDRFLKSAKTAYIPEAIGKFIGLWWMFYIIRRVFNLVFYYLEEETFEQLIVSTKVYIASDIIGILAAIVAVIMVTKVSEKETLVKETVAEVNRKNELIQLKATEEE